jgi:general L-amino acid transport system substrate-binding protein
MMMDVVRQAAPMQRSRSPVRGRVGRLPMAWLLLLFAWVISGCRASDGDGGVGAAVRSPKLDLIRSRGRLICGVEGTMPGFSRVDPSGRYIGLDVDVCRAVAAAALGDGEKVEFHNLSAGERFAAVASGEVDLLSRNTTLTLSRDATGGNALSFGPIVYYDGQGFLVPADSEVRKPSDLAGRTICVVTGTTTELNLADWMRQQGLPYTSLKFQSHDQNYAAYLQGRCAALTSNLALLASRRSTFPDPSAHRLLPETISKEPNAPAVSQSDPVWADAVRWTLYGLIQAEEQGLTQANVKQRLASAEADPSQVKLRRLLGVEGSLGRELGLPADFLPRAIEAVGNYGEIFERHLGRGSPLKLERGRNQLWTRGGLMVSPPFQ